jgi:hypothetical protein
MTRILVLGMSVAAMLAGATVALAGGGDDDDGYPTKSSATTTGATTPAAAHKTSTYTYAAKLGSTGEVPKPNAPAKAAGGFSATVKDNGTSATVRWTLTFRRLSGRAVAAHIHIGRPGVAGPVVLPLCGPCKTGATGRGTLTHDQAEMLEEGRGYVNVHTARNQGGEIRGQLRLTSHA